MVNCDLMTVDPSSMFILINPCSASPRSIITLRFFFEWLVFQKNTAASPGTLMWRIFFCDLDKKRYNS